MVYEIFKIVAHVDLFITQPTNSDSHAGKPKKSKILLPYIGSSANVRFNWVKEDEFCIFKLYIFINCCC